MLTLRTSFGSPFGRKPRIAISLLGIEERNFSGAAMALTRRDRDRVFVNAEVWEGGRAHGAVRRFHLKDVAAIDAEALGGLGMNLDP